MTIRHFDFVFYNNNNQTIGLIAAIDRPAKKHAVIQKYKNRKSLVFRNRNIQLYFTIVYGSKI